MIYSSLVKYSNVCYLGEGSQATVYSAVYEKTKKPVAIKMYTSNSITSFREIRILKRIQTLKLKHSLDYIESFIENDKLFIVSEFIEGGELHDFVRHQILCNAKCSQKHLQENIKSMKSYTTITFATWI